MPSGQRTLNVVDAARVAPIPAARVPRLRISSGALAYTGTIYRYRDPLPPARIE